MEQLVLVPPSVHNNKKSLDTRAVTKRELPTYPAEQNRTYQTDSLKKKTNRKLFAGADFLVEKTLSFGRMKLSISQISILDGVETAVLLSDSAQQLHCENVDVPDLYFTLLDAGGIIPTLFLNQNVKARDRKSWFPFKLWKSWAAKIVNA